MSLSSGEPESNYNTKVKVIDANGYRFKLVSNRKALQLVADGNAVVYSKRNPVIIQMVSWAKKRSIFSKITYDNNCIFKECSSESEAELVYVCMRKFLQSIMPFVRSITGKDVPKIYIDKTSGHYVVKIEFKKPLEDDYIVLIVDRFKSAWN